jgi:hypothetical protein
MSACGTNAKRWPRAAISEIGAKAEDITRDKLAGWVEPFARPIALADENRRVSLRSTHPARVAGSEPARGRRKR